ncbi:MAG: undecaprenyl-diphosphate phosphatase [Thermoguttaceae bacterium]|nr:undecaprenyl-diphosphate phosphatase [Thermoguttaceae bacterium]
MDAIKILILAIVQGIGEFLPISSSGHLTVLGDILFSDSTLLDEEKMFTLNILLHAGTLGAVLIYFWRQICEAFFKTPRTLALIVVGSIPTVAIGLAMKKFADPLLDSPKVAGFCFIITGILLLTLVRGKKKSAQDEYLEEAERMSSEEAGEIEAFKDGKTLEQTSWFDALFIGFAQGCAVLPGISRSGSTIAGGVLRGLSRETAATYSFLLSIPVIAGGALLEIVDMIGGYKASGKPFDLQSDPLLTLYLLGAAVSFGVGLVALVYLMRWLKAGKIHYFAYWLFVFGPFTIIWSFWPEISALFNAG